MLHFLIFLCGAVSAVLVIACIFGIKHAFETCEYRKEETEYYKSLTGTLGSNINWNIDKHGTLFITGNGEIEEISSQVSPWIYYFDEVKKAVISDGITNIPDYMFSKCSSLVEVIIPNSVKTIGASSFDGCFDLKSIHIPCNVTYIGLHAFNNCINLTEIIIPDSVTDIGPAILDGCQKLQSVKLSNNISQITEEMFQNCNNLREVVIPNNVTQICEFAFRCFGNEDGLKKITIPKSVVCIESKAFAACGNLSDVYYLGSEDDWDKINIHPDNSGLVNANIYFLG